MKLEYYKRKEWEQYYIEDAKETLKKIYSHYIPPAEEKVPIVRDDSLKRIKKHLFQGSVHGPAVTQQLKELDRYLSSDCPDENIVNVLEWWQVCTIMLYSQLFKLSHS